MTTSFAAIYDAECKEDEVRELWEKIIALPIGSRATIAAAVAVAIDQSEADCRRRRRLIGAIPISRRSRF